MHAEVDARQRHPEHEQPDEQRGDAAKPARRADRVQHHHGAGEHAHGTHGVPARKGERGGRVDQVAKVRWASAVEEELQPGAEHERTEGSDGHEQGGAFAPHDQQCRHHRHRHHRHADAPAEQREGEHQPVEGATPGVHGREDERVDAVDAALSHLGRQIGE